MPVFRPGKPWRTLEQDGSSAPAATPAPVVWASATGDGEFDPSSDLTSTVVALSGLYLVTCGVFRGARATSAVFRLSVQLNAVDVVISDADASAAARGASVSWCGQLVAGDAVRAVVVNNGGATLAADGSHLTIVRIGPVRWT